MTTPVVTPDNIDKFRFSDVINRRYWDTKYTEIIFRSNVVSSAVGGGATSGTSGNTNVMITNSNASLEWFVIGTQTTLAPTITNTGLDISQTQTVALGAEWSQGVTQTCPSLFTVGTDDPFFVQLKFKIATATGVNPILLGFRKQAAAGATFSSYTDFATIGIVGTAGHLQTETQVATGGVITTDTTQLWANGETHILTVLVDGSGNVTYFIDGVAPLVTVPFQFTNGTAVIPVLRFVQAAGLSGAIELIKYTCGYQVLVG